jgi:hypothetical protein
MKNDWSFASREAICGADDGLVPTLVARGVSGLAHNNEFATAPILPKPPWRDERGAKIQSAVDKNAWNAEKTLRFSQENAVLKPGFVAPIVSHETRNTRLPRDRSTIRAEERNR